MTCRDPLHVSPAQAVVLRAMVAHGALRFVPRSGRFAVGDVLCWRATARALYESGLIEREGDSGRALLNYVITEKGRLAVSTMAAA